jgi:hypothetical protein
LKKARPRSGDTILALLEKREIKIVIYRGNASINSVEVGQAEAGDQHITALSPFLQVCRYDFFFLKTGKYDLRAWKPAQRVGAGIAKPV